MPPRCQLLFWSLPCAPRVLTPAARRTFTSSATLSKDTGSHLPINVIGRDAIIPPYPYGESLLFKQSNKGLYGGQTIQFGNNVSRKTETKSRRSWKPNVLRKSLYSIALKKRIKLRVTSKVLKTIDREGGLDEYLLKESEARIKELGPTGWALRWRIMQTAVVKARFRAEAAAIGLPQSVIDERWPLTPGELPSEAEELVSEDTVLEEIEAEALMPPETMAEEMILGEPAEIDKDDTWDEHVRKPSV